jgi:hypothetical protein
VKLSQPVLFVIDDDLGVVDALRDDFQPAVDGGTAVRLAHEYLAPEHEDKLSLTTEG